MALEVKRKRVEVDLILDQEKAERISQLGEQLARAAASHVTEGANAAAKRIARQIDELREEVSGQIVHLTLEALPLSQWRQVLEANTTTTKDGRAAQRLEDITADALRLMIRKSVPETPVEDIAAIIPELSDGQLSPVWYAIQNLNARMIDPKDCLGQASRIIRGWSGNGGSAPGSASATSAGSGGSPPIAWSAMATGASPGTRRKANGTRPNATGCSPSTTTSTACARAAACP